MSLRNLRSAREQAAVIRGTPVPPVPTAPAVADAATVIVDETRAGLPLEEPVQEKPFAALHALPPEELLNYLCETEKASIEEVFEFVDPATRMELIPVRDHAEKKPGYDIVIARSKLAPEQGILLWSKHLTDTRYQLSFNVLGGKPSREFSVLCACCPIEEEGVTIPDGLSKDEVAVLEKSLPYSFANALEAACAASGVKNLFMRKPSSWRLPYKSFGRGSLDELEEVIGEHGPVPAELLASINRDASTMS